MSIKKIIFPAALIGSIGIGTLSAVYLNKKDELEKTSSVTTEEQVEVNLTINGKTTRELAEESYRNYEKFYKESGITVDEIDIMVNILNDNVEGYNQDQITDALVLVDQILLSSNTSQSIDNINAEKKFDSISPCETLICPKISDFIVSSDVRDDIIGYENLRDELINEIIESKNDPNSNTVNGTYSQDIVNKISQATLDMEISQYNTGNDDMSANLSSEGLSYALTASKYSLCQLCTSVLPEDVHFINNEGGYSIQVSLTPEEIDTNSIAYILDSNSPDDIKLQNAENQKKLISTKYFDSLCSIKVLILKKAGYFIDESSKSNQIENLKAQREILQEINMLSMSNEKLKGLTLSI